MCVINAEYLCLGYITLKRMEYIHETAQMAKSYQDGVSQTRKTTLATLGFELSPLPKIHVV